MLHKKLISLFLIVGLCSSATMHPIWGFDWLFGSSNQSTADTQKIINAVNIGSLVVSVGMAAYITITGYRHKKNIEMLNEQAATRAAQLKIHDENTAADINKMKEESAEKLRTYDLETAAKINEMKENFQKSHLLAEAQLSEAIKKFETQTADLEAHKASLREREAGLVEAYKARVEALEVFKAQLQSKTLKRYQVAVAVYKAQQKAEAETCMFFGKYYKRDTRYKGHSAVAQAQGLNSGVLEYSGHGTNNELPPLDDGIQMGNGQKLIK